MERRRPTILLVFVLSLFATGPSAQPPVEGSEAGRRLIVKALERAAWYVDEEVSARYRSRMTRVVRYFDRHGDVRSEDAGEYDVVPIEGVQFERRLTIGSRPLNEAERLREERREAEFREDWRRQRVFNREREELEDSIVFNEELVARYVFSLEGQEPYRGRPSYRVAFEPRPGRLPVRRQIDYALNKTRGHVWIDRDTHEPARLEFELIGPVRIWWGVLGSIHYVRGSLDRIPVLDELWLPTQLEFYGDVRRFLRRTRRSEFRQWRDFEWVDK